MPGWPARLAVVVAGPGADGPGAELDACFAAYAEADWDARLPGDWPPDELARRILGGCRMRVQLRLLDKADKEIAKLPRAVKGAIYDFQRKFREDPDANGLQLKQLAGDSRLYSARVTDAYRALLLRVTGTEYLLVAVKPRGSVYENLERYAYQVNPVSGGIEFVDVVHLESVHLGAAAVPDDRSGALFAAYSNAQLLDLGVAEPLLPLIAKISTEDELLGLAEYAPQLTAEVLLALHDGLSPDEVLAQVTTPVRADEPVDVADFEAALARPATVVTTDDAALQAVLEGDFARWQVFLHPLQRKIVERGYKGPARVSGGPGTGKTIVALHRVKHLVDGLPSGDDQRILFTTFNKNLAADLRGRLLELAGRDILERVDVVNIDSLAAKVVAESRAARAASLARRLQGRRTVGRPAPPSWRCTPDGESTMNGRPLSSPRPSPPGTSASALAVRAGGETLYGAQRAEEIGDVPSSSPETSPSTTFAMSARLPPTPLASPWPARRAATTAISTSWWMRRRTCRPLTGCCSAPWSRPVPIICPGRAIPTSGSTRTTMFLGGLGIAIRGRSTRLDAQPPDPPTRSWPLLSACSESRTGTTWMAGPRSSTGTDRCCTAPPRRWPGYASWADELAAMAAQAQEWQPADGGPAALGIAVPDGCRWPSGHLPQ